MWDELDLWHSKLNELDSEVQDIVEQDPGQAQEWMDKLMIPFQLMPTGKFGNFKK